LNASQDRAVTELLVRVRAGDHAAFDELVSIVYEELRTLARIQRRRWTGDETLNTTALVHEAYLKLAVQDEPQWQNRAHFERVAAKAMRQILIDYSRAQRALKRGGEQARVSFDSLKVAAHGEFSGEHAEALIALDLALTKLSKVSDRQAQIAECRLFGDMTVPDTAVALGTSPATAKRSWAVAKAWLYRELG
jgi:RNA polymerase sigma factor (TIGR02999 family)